MRDVAHLAALLAIAAAAALLSGCGGTEELAPPEEPADGDADSVRLVVYKARREVVLSRPGQPPKTYHAALGSNPDGDKQREGDGRTPTGTFYVCQKNSDSKYFLFIGISYPNEEDAARGQTDGLITAAEHDAILSALANRKSPPWYTRLGGEIGLHGGGAGWDWTRGCIALDNADIRELYRYVRVGTMVVIEP